MPNTEVKPSVQPVGRSVSVSFCRTFASTSRPCCTCRCTQSLPTIRCFNWMEQRNINEYPPQKHRIQHVSTLTHPYFYHVPSFSPRFPSLSPQFFIIFSHFPHVSPQPSRGIPRVPASRPRSTSAAARAMCDSRESKVEAWSSAAEASRLVDRLVTRPIHQEEITMD